MSAENAHRVRILFGGSFDPPTAAHRQLIEIALGAHPCAELVVIPAGTAPNKRDRATTPARHRLEMARIAFRDLPRVRVSDEEIVRGGTSWTVETLERHRDELGKSARLFFLLGADSLLGFGKWRQPQRILELAKILAVARPGFDLRDLDAVEDLDATTKTRLRAGILVGSGPDISSTELRARVRDAHGRGTEATAAKTDTIPHLDPAVRAYIDRHGLYQDPA